MRTTNRPTFTDILCYIGVLLCVSSIGAIIVDFFSDGRMKTLGEWTERVNIVESFYTTNQYGNPQYFLMWENDKYGGVMEVCSSCYMKYRDAAQMPIKMKELESNHTHGYNFELHNHYNYERTDK